MLCPEQTCTSIIGRDYCVKTQYQSPRLLERVLLDPIFINIDSEYIFNSLWIVKQVVQLERLTSELPMPTNNKIMAGMAVV